MTHEEICRCITILLQKDPDMTPLNALFFIFEYHNDIQKGDARRMNLIADDFDINVNLNNSREYYIARASFFQYKDKYVSNFRKNQLLKLFT